jgi:predicted dehydrogenase
MNTIWLIGSGAMAIDYIKVLEGLNTSFTVVGRGAMSASACEKATGCKVIVGGLENFLSTNPEICTHAIIAVGVELLSETSLALLEYGVKNILVEKPAGLNALEIDRLDSAAKKQNAKIYVAYNRRFYGSVEKAKEIILADGGVTSFNFEFTEWAHVIEPLEKGSGVKEHWFLANSTHVVDLAFFLGGKPKEISCFVTGGLSWHPSGSVFSGAGISESGALFSYQANWESAGRWSVEILTKMHRLILRPMEKLQIQQRGKIAQEFVEFDDEIDTLYKPGLFQQTKAFLTNDTYDLCSIDIQKQMMYTYNQMGNFYLEEDKN